MDRCFGKEWAAPGCLIDQCPDHDDCADVCYNAGPGVVVILEEKDANYLDCFGASGDTDAFCETQCTWHFHCERHSRDQSHQGAIIILKEKE